jgi:hypothetical protein
MVARRLVVAVGLVALFTLALRQPSHAAGPMNSTMYLTFSGSVALPGVTLPAGTYTFERFDPFGAPDVVRVLNRKGDKTYFLGFTQRVSRPWNARNQPPVKFGEARPGEPVPVEVWFPADETVGHQFIYR